MRCEFTVLKTLSVSLLTLCSLLAHSRALADEPQQLANLNDEHAVSRGQAASALSAGSPMLTGVASCTASNCHGGRSLVGGEATHWLRFDVKHRQAYDVLHSELSRSMAAKLGLRDAHTDARCLACHSSNAGQLTVTTGPRHAVEFGVGCEACHGAAGNWLSAHSQRSWRTLSNLQKAELGFRDLKSWTARANACAVCHVGSESATVDHDLIAAGHPRLTFDLSAYHAMLPKHWDSSAETRRDPMLEARLWILGQLTSAKVMADISTARAAKATRERTPHVAADLAEFDCHACHHQLSDEAWRRGAASRTSLGIPQWGSWNVSPALWLARLSSTESRAIGNSAASESLSELTIQWQSSRLGVTSATALQSSGQRASDSLAAWRQTWETAPLDRATVSQLHRALLSEQADSEWKPTWDGQAQRYLAIASVTASLQTPSEKPARDTVPDSPLKPLRDRLRFPTNYATPLRFEPDVVTELFRQLRERDQK